MRVAKITIHNLLGIDHLELTPGQFTCVSGPNGVGKTSILEAIKAALGGGHDASLLRNGADRGECVLLLDDGTEIARHVTVDESKTQVRDPRFGYVSQPRKVVSGLIDPLQVNPIAFLTAKGKDRLSMLLEAIPLELSAADVKTALGNAPADIPKGHALQVLENVRKQVFETRTGCNRALKEKDGTANQLQATLPPGEELARDWHSESRRLNEELAAAREGLTKQISAADLDAATAIKEIEAEERAEVDAAVAEIRKRHAARKETVTRGREEIKESVRKAASAKIEDLTTRAATAAEKAKEHTRAKTQLELLANMRVDVARLEGESATLTAAIERLDALKERLVSTLPIQGLEVRDGEIYLDGVAFDRVNTATQIRFAIELARLRAGKLGLVVVDGLERMDAAFFAAFEAAAMATDLQWLVTRVTDSKELDVRTVGEIPTAAPPDVGPEAIDAAPQPVPTKKLSATIRPISATPRKEVANAPAPRTAEEECPI